MQPVSDRIRAALRSEAGEGVISTGIVVLIMALLGATMWVTFNAVMSDTGERVGDSVEEIGNDGG